MNLPAGSSVTPPPSMGSGGGDQHYYDFRGAVVTDDLMRKAEFAGATRVAHGRFIGEALADFSEVRKRTAGRG